MEEEELELLLERERRTEESFLSDYLNSRIWNEKTQKWVDEKEEKELDS